MAFFNVNFTVIDRFKNEKEQAAADGCVVLCTKDTNMRVNSN